MLDCLAGVLHIKTVNCSTCSFPTHIDWQPICYMPFFLIHHHKFFWHLLACGVWMSGKMLWGCQPSLAPLAKNLLIFFEFLRMGKWDTSLFVSFSWPSANSSVGICFGFEAERSEIISLRLVNPQRNSSHTIQTQIFSFPQALQACFWVYFVDSTFFDRSKKCDPF